MSWEAANISLSTSGADEDFKVNLKCFTLDFPESSWVLPSGDTANYIKMVSLKEMP